MAFAKDKVKLQLKDMENQHKKNIKLNQRMVSVGRANGGVERKIVTSHKERMERLFQGKSGIPHKRGSWQVSENNFKMRVIEEGRKLKLEIEAEAGRGGRLRPSFVENLPGCEEDLEVMVGVAKENAEQTRGLTERPAKKGRLYLYR